MKRQRHNIADEGKFTMQVAATNAEHIVRKKSKGGVVVEKVEEKEEEEAKVNNVAAAAAELAWLAATVAENWLCNCEEWAWLTGEVVDVQMSWGYFSLPVWGVEFMVESYSSLFSDVAWDDDIWNLKSIMEIPASP